MLIRFFDQSFSMDVGQEISKHMERLEVNNQYLTSSGPGRTRIRVISLIVLGRILRVLQLWGIQMDIDNMPELKRAAVQKGSHPDFGMNREKRKLFMENSIGLVASSFYWIPRGILNNFYLHMMIMGSHGIHNLIAHNLPIFSGPLH